jgi:hypothetical protein
MLFSEPKSLNNIQVTSSSPKDTSLYSETLEMTLQFNEEWFNLRRKMMNLEHTSIVSENMELLNEGSKEFFSQIANMFSKLFSQITGLWRKFVSTMHKTFLSDKEFIEKYEGAIRRADISGLDYKGFIYTINSEVPSIKPDADFIINDHYLGNNFSNLSHLSASDIQAHYNNLSIDESRFDEIRGKVLGRDRISADLFRDKLFSTFRNDDKEPNDIELTSGVVDVMIDSLLNYERDVKKCGEMQKNISKFYEEVIHYFNGMTKVEYHIDKRNIHVSHYKSNADEYSFQRTGESKGFELDSEDGDALIEAIHTAAKLKSEEARKISFIYNSAFSAKLDAVKERRMEYMKVLSAIIARG